MMAPSFYIYSLKKKDRVCVCERERERGREGGREQSIRYNQPHPANIGALPSFVGTLAYKVLKNCFLPHNDQFLHLIYEK
jgi:hypothetical protein